MGLGIRSAFEVLRNGGELFEGGHEIVGDLLGIDPWGWQVGGFLQGLVLQIEVVEVPRGCAGRKKRGEGGRFQTPDGEWCTREESNLKPADP